MVEVLECIEPKVTEEMNEMLCGNYSGGEVEIALKQMHPHKAPGPDAIHSFILNTGTLLGEM